MLNNERELQLCQKRVLQHLRFEVQDYTYGIVSYGRYQDTLDRLANVDLLQLLKIQSAVSGCEHFSVGSF